MTIGRRWTCALVCIAVLASCQTTKKAEPAPEPMTPTEFRPATSVSGISLETGQYPNLFTPDSFAVWVGPEVAALKREKEEKVNSDYDAIWKEVMQNYFVIECHVGSAFGDTSIAYDVVGFRGIDPFLLTPAGQQIRPIQTVIDESVEETQQEALKLFRRTNLLIFPRRNLFVDAPTVDPNATSIRLVLEGHNSTFYFEWPGIPTAAEAHRWSPSESETLQAVKLGFNKLFERIRRLSRRFT